MSIIPKLNDVRFFQITCPNTSFVIDLTEVSGILYDSRNDTIKVILSGFTFDIPEPKDNALEKIIDAWKAVKGTAHT